MNQRYLYWNRVSEGFDVVEYGPERRLELLCPSSRPLVGDPLSSSFFGGQCLTSFVGSTEYQEFVRIVVQCK